MPAFSKIFSDEKLAVETQFHIAESYFELFKSHKALDREAEERRPTWKRAGAVLREVMEDYPESEVHAADRLPARPVRPGIEAVGRGDRVVPDDREAVSRTTSLAPDAQYKLAQCYEEAGEFDQALEAYVTLAATYPKSPLIANVMVRISEHFYKTENFKVAAQVGEKFLEKFEGHKWAPKMAFRVGQCYYKDKQYAKAGEAFDQFAKIFPDDALASDALFWSGESYRMAQQHEEGVRALQQVPLGLPRQRGGQVRPRPAWPCPRCCSSSRRKRTAWRTIREMRKSDCGVAEPV